MPFRKNVFILGAGFSSEAGAPLMRNFFPLARDIRDDPASPLTEPERQRFGNVIQYRFGLNKALAKVHFDLDNIEQLFGFMEMDLQLARTADSTLRIDMTYLIARTLEILTSGALRKQESQILTGTAQETKYPFRFEGTQYGFFVGLVAGLWNPAKQENRVSRDAVITFNYDLLLEREMIPLGLGPEYSLDPARSDLPMVFANPVLRLKLLKMHGSTNWIVCSECKDRIYVRVPNEAQVASVVGAQPCPACHQTTLRPFIVPPTWNKGIEEGFLRPVWSTALQELLGAGRIFIVGYSFPETDQFFKYLLGLALAHNNDLSEVWIVNPGREAHERFELLFSPYFRQRVVQSESWSTRLFIVNLQGVTKQEIKAADLNGRFVRQ
jgi:NAD-dependent SIR2 family protein deacetylase